MRRLILGVAAACAIVALTASGAPAKNGNGVMCVLHARLTTTNETTGSTSTARGHTQIKVRANGTIEFKTHILNQDGETFVAGHIHQAPVGVAGPIVVPLLELFRHPVFCVVRPRLEQLVRVVVVLDALVRARGNAMEEAEVERLEHPPFRRAELVQEPLLPELA